MSDVTRFTDPANEEIRELYDQIDRLHLNNLESSVLQRQSTSEPFLFVLEAFDHTNRALTVDVLDDQKCDTTVVGQKFYRVMETRPSHTHSYAELMVVLDGSIQNVIEDETFIYRAGQGCMMNSNIRHREVPIADAVVLFVTLKEEFVQELLRAVRQEHASLKPSSLSTFLYTFTSDDQKAFNRQYWDFSPTESHDLSGHAHGLLCETALNALREKQPGSSYLARASILAFLTELSDPTCYTLQTVSTEMDHKAFLASKIDFLVQASYGNIDKKELEDQLSYNGDYLNRIYKQQTGQTIAEARHIAMLLGARTLLQETDLSIDDIMEQLGVTSRGHFFSSFQEATGMTPAKYRKEHR